MARGDFQSECLHGGRGVIRHLESARKLGHPTRPNHPGMGLTATLTTPSSNNEEVRMKTPTSHDVVLLWWRDGEYDEIPDDIPASLLRTV